MPEARRAKLTKTYIEGAAYEGRPPNGRDLRYDAEPVANELPVAGLALRVYPSGKKSWVLRYRTKAGLERLQGLGAYGVLTLFEARAKAKIELGLVESGADPVAVRKAERARAITVTELRERYIKEWAKPQTRTWEEAERLLVRYVEPAFGARRADAFTREDLYVLILSIGEKTPIQALQVYAQVRALYNWASYTRGLLPATPFGRMKFPFKRTSRERILTDDEIRVFWTATGEAIAAGTEPAPPGRVRLKAGPYRIADSVAQFVAVGHAPTARDVAEACPERTPQSVCSTLGYLTELGVVCRTNAGRGGRAGPFTYRLAPGVEIEEARAPMSPEIASILRLVLLTGQREHMLCGLHKSELEAHWWTLGAARMKKAVSHRAYLTDLALAELGTFEGYRYPAPTQSGAIVVNDLSRAVREAGFLGLPHWTPYDLRRTMATALGKAGVDERLIGRILSHKKEGDDVTKIYNRYRYDREKKEALELWEQRLLAILGPRAPAPALPTRARLRVLK